MTRLLDKETREWRATIRWEDRMVDYDTDKLEAEE